MTPEEKQAIIDKALDLGFSIHPRSNGFYYGFFKGKTLYYHSFDSMFGEFNGSYNDKEKITSPEQLETLFNAIVS